MIETRKNNTKQQIKWIDSPYFTISQLEKNNPEIKPITLRSKLKKAEDNKEIAVIGFLGNGKGRPENIYAKTPITENVLQMLEHNNIVLADMVREKYIDVVSVKNQLSAKNTKLYA